VSFTVDGKPDANIRETVDRKVVAGLGIEVSGSHKLTKPRGDVRTKCR